MKKTIIYIALLFSAFCLISCGYTERTQARSAATVAQANALSDQAKADAQIADAQAGVANMHTLADAAKPDNTVLILVLLGVFGLGGVVIYWLMKTNYLQAQITQAVIMAQLPQVQYKVLPEPPRYVQIAARHWQGEPQWNGEQWLIVDSDGQELASERKRIG